MAVMRARHRRSVIRLMDQVMGSAAMVEYVQLDLKSPWSWSA